MSCSVSIITPTFNSASYVRDCLDSVKAQGCDIEHIVIDCNSKDGTLEIIGAYPHVTRIVSEPDDGIYDAMNKGISLASGEVIGILNSDDFYVDQGVLRRVSKAFEAETLDSCYGDLQYVDANDISKITRKWKAGFFTCNGFLWGWMPPHPTFFVRRRVYERYGLFNLAMGSAADYELMLRFLLKHKITTTYLPETLVKMRTNGVSNASLANRLRANRMDRKAWEINGIQPYPWTTYLKPLRKIGQYLVL